MLWVRRAATSRSSTSPPRDLNTSRLPGFGKLGPLRLAGHEQAAPRVAARARGNAPCGDKCRA
eukprot:16269610-Heterocapsa_arctica.AAC.1